MFAVATLLGFRPDLAVAILGMTFWMKTGYAMALAVAGFWAAVRLARPAGSAQGGLWLAASALRHEVSCHSLDEAGNDAATLQGKIR